MYWENDVMRINGYWSFKIISIKRLIKIFKK